ncbi:hypothetical protein E5161_16440 [Cohnella pontilimi]|uniref:Glycosyltransferase RgtA/B/C/D-like domain-containing protein n=1 Tax=Cohnella pontilimi TaxID=2564100 RepID=A0A4U0F7R8_9BACL|nr:hypothetical protein [Cohnella pontilimi]TJY40735.1 hypothetical protein E5161_16440 [Cohnella pontilimi]
MKAFKKVLVLFLASRLLISLFLLVGQPEHMNYMDNQIQMQNPILDHFIIYDSYNYKQIALEGYAEDRLTAFFPLFPLLVRGVHEVTGIGIYWAGFLLSNLFFLGSLWLLDQLMEKRGIGQRTRVLAQAILVFFPSTYFFSAFYTESFFLFLALLAFRFWGEEKREAAYLIGGLAALSRMVGVWVPLAFFLERLIRRKLDLKDVVWAFASSLMFFMYPGYLWLTRGDPLLFLKVMGPHYGRHSALPFFPIYQDIVWSIEKWHEIRYIDYITILHFILFTIFVGYIISNIRLWRKGANVIWSEVIFTSGVITMALSSQLNLSFEIATHGFMRYFLPAFPIFIFMGQQSDRAVMRADLRSGSRFILARKFVNYLTLLVWVIFSVIVLLGLRVKGFVA